MSGEGCREHSTKEEFWQVVRGICILTVIMIHGPSGGRFGITSNSYILWIIIRQIINFPVAMFIFLSGYFVNQKRCIKDSKSYVLKRSKRLLIPFLTWSMFYTLLTVLQTMVNHDYISIKEIVYKFLIGKSATPLYYIVVLVQLTVLTPYLSKNVEGYRKKDTKDNAIRQIIKSNWPYLISPAYLILLYFYNIYTGNMPPLYETFFPAWFIFYYLGLDISKNSSKFRSIITKFGSVRMLLVALFVNFVEIITLLYFGCSVNFVTSQIKLSSFLYATVLIIILLQTFDKKDQIVKDLVYMGGGGCHSIFFEIKNFIMIHFIKVLKSFGNLSYAIYYVHMFILMIIHRVLAPTGISKHWIISFPVVFLLTSIGSIVFVKITTWLLTKFKLKKVLQLMGFD